MSFEKELEQISIRMKALEKTRLYAIKRAEEAELHESVAMRTIESARKACGRFLGSTESLQMCVARMAKQLSEFQADRDRREGSAHHAPG